jgi:hypothetical protein
MSTVHAPRGKGRSMYRPADELVPWISPSPAGPRKLKTRQQCYVCFDPMPIGWFAVFSPRRRKWRHTTCDNPQE